MTAVDEDPRAALARLHEATSARFERTLAAVGHLPGCGRGCADCCVDELTVWQIEADHMRAWLIERIQRDPAFVLKVGPEGACAFLSEGRCQVYGARPYVCRSQGAVLRWLEDDGESIRERRETCPVHLRGVDLERLPEAALFHIGPAEGELVSLATRQLASTGGRGLPRRVGLRQLALAIAATGRGDQSFDSTD